MLVYVYVGSATNDKLASTYNEEHRTELRNYTSELEGSNGQVLVDYDEDNNILGIEFLDAVRITSEEA